MHARHLLLIVAASCLALTGCAGGGKSAIDHGVNVPKDHISPANAEAIARIAVDSNDGWAHEADFFVAKTDKTWTVTARRVTGVNELNQKVYDAHQERYVVISRTGRILAYVRGR